MTPSNLATDLAPASSKAQKLFIDRAVGLLANDYFAAVLLFLVGLFTRLPFRSAVLYHWDSVNFSFALQEFNLAKEQPQPPGYILYVLLARAVNLIFHDPQKTMVGISVISSALAVAALFFLGRSLFDRKVGITAALFLAFSPLYWFYGEIALPHTLDALLVIVSVWWLYETMRGKRSYLFPAIAAAAISGGVRQQTLIFLLPSLLFALRKVGWKDWLMAGSLGTALSLAWFIPLMAWSGGITNYLSVMNQFTDRFQATTSLFMGAGWPGLRRNLIKLSLYTAYGWGFAALPILAAAWVWLRHRKPPAFSERGLFLGLWIAPPLLYYGLVHMGQQGLVFVFLPALCLLGAFALAGLTRSHPRRLITGVFLISLLHTAIFCLVPEYPLGPDSQRVLTRAALVNSDQYFQERFDAIRQNFPPGQTAILAANWHHLDYYLPDYVRIPFGIGSKWELDEGMPLTSLSNPVVLSPTDLGLKTNPDTGMTVVIFDPDLEKFNRSPGQANQLALRGGGTLEYFRLSPSARLSLDPVSFGIAGTGK